MLKLYFHPLSSFCHKALIALYEHGAGFEPVQIDLGDAASRAELADVWPMLKFPVLRDEARGRDIAESSVIIEYLDMFHAGAKRLLPQDPDLQWQCRMWDRFCDHFLQHPMQKIVGDALRPDGRNDGHGVEEARNNLVRAYDVLESHLEGHGWTVGDSFTIADCSAAPALFYSHAILPYGPDRPRLNALLRKLMQRPSYVRVLREAEPYFHLFPLEPKPSLAPPAMPAMESSR